MATNGRQAGAPRVVIVGGGFGGLYAARALATAPVQITIVDQRNYHLFQPLLYQVATAALSPGNIAQPIRQLLRRYRNVRVLQAQATAIDLTARRALLTFAIVGGGPTGVELAGAIAEIARHAVAGEFRAIDPNQAR